MSIFSFVNIYVYGFVLLNIMFKLYLILCFSLTPAHVELIFYIKFWGTKLETRLQLPFRSIALYCLYLKERDCRNAYEHCKN